MALGGLTCERMCERLATDAEGVLDELESVIVELRSLLPGESSEPSWDAEETQGIWQLACSLWEAGLNSIQTAAPNVQARLMAVGKALFDTVSVSGQGTHRLQMPTTLLQIGRSWIAAGNLLNAEWFVTSARRLGEEQLQLVSNAAEAEDEDASLEHRNSCHGQLEADILLSSLQLAIVGAMSVN